MPRKPSKPKRRILPGAKLTQAQLDSLKLKDFLGLLSPDEIPIAKKHGLFKWDSWNKAGRPPNSGLVVRK